MEIEPSASAAPLDYLSDPAIAAFFIAREHEAYYLSLKSVDERRRFHDNLIVALVQVLELVDERVEGVIDDILLRCARQERPWRYEDARPFDPVEEVRCEETVGVELLGIAGKINFEALRVAYRAAALRYHPDRGGSNAEMAAVNRAYELLHALLGESTFVTNPSLGDGWAQDLPTTRDYIWSVTFLLLETTLDDWALDEATHWLEHLTASLIAPTSETPTTGLSDRALGDVAPTATLAPFEFSYSRSRRDDRLIRLTQPSATLAERLAACQERELAARRALAIAEIGLERARAARLNYNFYVSRAKDVVEGRRKPRFVLNHTQQIDNAFRLGAIDEKRYEANFKRVSDQNAAGEISRRAREELLSGTAFIQRLPADVSLSTNEVRTGLVPHPDYYQCRFETLGAEQQAEYRDAFGRAPKLELVEKYAWIRASSLLRSAIQFFGDADIAALADEARLLSKLQPRCRHAGWDAEILLTLAELDKEAARRLAHALHLLLKPEPPEPPQRGSVRISVARAGLHEGTPQFFHEANLLCDRFRKAGRAQT